MINIGTFLRIADNSGGVVAKCIGVSRISKRRIFPGHIINVVIKKNVYKEHIKKKSKIITKGMMCKALLLRIKKGLCRWGNFYVKGGQNMVILVNNYFVPYGTRLFGIFFREIRNNQKFKRLFSLALYSL